MRTDCLFSISPFLLHFSIPLPFFPFSLPPSSFLYSFIPISPSLTSLFTSLLSIPIPIPLPLPSYSSSYTRSYPLPPIWWSLHYTTLQILSPAESLPRLHEFVALDNLPPEYGGTACDIYRPKDNTEQVQVPRLSSVTRTIRVPCGMNLTVDSYVNDGSLDISVYYEEAETDAVRTLYATCYRCFCNFNYVVSYHFFHVM